MYPHVCACVCGCLCLPDFCLCGRSCTTCDLRFKSAGQEKHPLDALALTGISPNVADDGGAKAALGDDAAAEEDPAGEDPVGEFC
jgi:hypothetical protein